MFDILKWNELCFVHISTNFKNEVCICMESNSFLKYMGFLISYVHAFSGIEI